MTQQTENRIIKKINYQLLTLIFVILGAVGSVLKVGYGWQRDVVNAVNQNKADNNLLRYEMGVNNTRVDKLELRQDRVESMVYSGKFQK